MILVKFILVHYGLLLILGKYDYRAKITRLANKTKIKLLYSLGECLFCCTHWVGALVVPLAVLGNGFSWEFLLFPLMSTAAIFLTGKQNN